MEESYVLLNQASGLHVYSIYSKAFNTSDFCICWIAFVYGCALLLGKATLSYACENNALYVQYVAERLAMEGFTMMNWP